MQLEFTNALPKMQYFNIRHVDLTVDVKEIETAITKEMENPGRLFSYRALHRRIREVHELYVPRDIVYAVQSDVNLDRIDNVSISERSKRKNPCKSMGSI